MKAKFDTNHRTPVDPIAVGTGIVASAGLLALGRKIA
tara:strand:- start:790 stop:900 length:111 start_codon:yes stop_codon:yes gene_type:complete